MERTTMDLWVGLFVVAGIGALLILALKVGNLGAFDAADTYALHAHFENIGGLKPRAPVKSAGVVVGRVDNVKFDNNTYVAVVTMKIDNRFQFPKDTFANIYTSGLLGEQYISLAPGGDSVNLKNGDKIAKTQSAVVLENLVSQFLYNKAEGGNK